MRTHPLFIVSSLVGASLVSDTPIYADGPVRTSAKGKAAPRQPAKAAPVPTKPPPPKEDLCRIDVKIENLRKNDGSYQGQLCYTLFRGKDGFPDKSELAVLNQCVKVEQSATLSFTIGERQCNHDYALAILHDENMNRQLDKNIAIPKEGVGMSNNPSFIRVNSPPYDDVKFTLQSPSAQQTIRMHYWP
jgi:uncharacterized protein (DUF2141 family)